MDTVKKYGLKKSKALILFLQMLLISFMFITAVYLLIFTIKYNLGGWMILSYVFILISILSIILYAIIGYKKGSIAYICAIAPFLIAVFINILIPYRDTFQIAMLVIVFALAFLFMFKLDSYKLNSIISFLMIVFSISFSIYSSIHANVNFLGEISAGIAAYLAMYLSIFIPVIMTSTFALTYNIRNTRIKDNDK